MDRLGALTAAALLVAGCSSGGSNTSGGDPPPPTRITVSGTVVDETGRPYAGAWVSVGNDGASSAADGTFSIANVALPYDVTVVAEGDLTITHVQGVRAAAPVLSFVRRSRGPLRTATVEGTATPETRSGHSAYVFGPETRTSPSLSGAYALPAAWHGEASTTLNVREILLDTGVPDGWPVGYAYAVRPVVVTDGGTIVGQDLAASALGAGHVAGTIAVSGDWHLPFSVFRMIPTAADGTAFTLFERGGDAAPLGAFDVVVPALPDGAFRLEYTTSSLLTEDASVSAPVVPGQTGVTLEPPPPPVATTPDLLHGHGFDTVLTWDEWNFTGSDFVTVACDSGHVFRIAGRMRATSLPSPSTRSIAIPTGTGCDWRAGWASYTVDELVLGPAAVAALPVVATSLSAYQRFWF